MQFANTARALLVLLALAAVLVIALAGALTQTRSIINCSTVSNPAQFVREHPEYLKRLDRDGDGKPCETKATSTNIWLNL